MAWMRVSMSELAHFTQSHSLECPGGLSSKNDIKELRQATHKHRHADINMVCSISAHSNCCPQIKVLYILHTSTARHSSPLPTRPDSHYPAGLAVPAARSAAAAAAAGLRAAAAAAAAVLLRLPGGPSPPVGGRLLAAAAATPGACRTTGVNVAGRCCQCLP